ncbi:MAP kinase kinase PBS2 [Wickerhamiella sorbophila]|uniref:mitogen-activated protein kinase kinase n=1 Tax=Wickerhamiella sorbophila TaxID=45607 RepID=A0A2T0FNG0_9ASCO|nr:MAP kinase kinase PBS2 [Wickerhamiella sorbophila]PRT56517.1 MAP kinase kinase PBS2 [Wickerhamiella sorbophila]
MSNDEQLPPTTGLQNLKLGGNGSNDSLKLCTDVGRKQSASSISSVEALSSPDSTLGSPAASSMMSGLAAEMQARVLALQSSRLKRTASSTSQPRGMTRKPSMCRTPSLYRTASTASNSNVDLTTPIPSDSSSEAASSVSSPVTTPTAELRRVELSDPPAGPHHPLNLDTSNDSSLSHQSIASDKNLSDRPLPARPASMPNVATGAMTDVPGGALTGAMPSGSLTGPIPSGALTGAPSGALTGVPGGALTGNLHRTPSASGRVLPVPTATTLKKAHMNLHGGSSMSSRFPGLSLREARGGSGPNGQNNEESLKPSKPRVSGGRRPSGLVLPPLPGGGGPQAAAMVGPAVRSQRKNKLFAYQKYIDIESGSLNFAGKAVIHSKGIDFSNGTSFQISLDELEPLEELGAGNYGTVTRVVHKPTKVEMAMKEIRLELDEASFRQILMELDILHRCHSEHMVDFYGAFFVEGAVYLCLEYMDGGSMNQIYENGIPEKYLREVSRSVVLGLKELKERHKIIHRDVKPTNVLSSSTTGKIKLCDFGVSGNLVASIARTNIGCQSYMAPERINYAASAQAAEYSVESDIWSLGLSIIEMAIGVYPYPAEIYSNIFSQLSAIVEGQPPQLDPKKFSAEACSFVAACLCKDPRVRASYADLLAHPWLANHPPLENHEIAEFVRERLEAAKGSK